MVGLAACVAAGLLSTAASAAACVVGTGTAASCPESALDRCLPGGGGFDGSVNFDCGAIPATITVTSTKAINANTTIDGGSLITISGGNSIRIFTMSGGVDFKVQNLTIANGYANTGFSGLDGGAGIYNDSGTLTVVNSTFLRNEIYYGYSGGAICNRWGTVTVSNSTFSNNGALGGTGGAINSHGTLMVSNSTFSGSRATGGLGGAIYNNGSLTVTNSTFAGNSAYTGAGDGLGGAIDAIGASTITNSTFVNNGAAFGGAIYTGGTAINCTFTDNYGWGAVYGNPQLTNCVIRNTSSTVNCSGTIADGGHNIEDGATCGFSAANGSLPNTDPRLDPAGLRHNGGPTQTVALCTGVGTPTGCAGASPAINAGDQAVCAAPPVNSLDQRGFARPGPGAINCSIGAVEFYLLQTPTPTPTAPPTGTPTPTPSDTAVRTSTPTLTPTTAVQTQQRFCGATSADDGRVNSSGLAYPPTGAPVVSTTSVSMDARRSRRTAGDYSVGVVLLRFDTALLPDDAIITAARLEAHVTGAGNTDARTLVGEFYAASNWPITAAAYTVVAPTVNKALEVPVAGLTVGQVASITVDPMLADQQVSRVGATGLRLHISGGQPTGPNYVEIAAQDHTTLPEPCLVIDYVRAVPTLTATPNRTPGTPTYTPTPAAGAPTSTPTSTPTTAVPIQRSFCEVISADDGRVNATGLSYPPTGAPVLSTTSATIDARRSRRTTGDYSVGVVLLRFDTGLLPDDAIITAARLEAHVTGIGNTDARMLVGELYAASNWPITAAAYTDVAPAVNKVLEVPVAGLAVGQVASITVDPMLADQQVSRVGATGLRLHISGGQPTGPNYVEIAAQDHTTLPAPCLVIDYVLAVPTFTPTMTPTAAPTRFVDNGNGTITDQQTGLMWEKKTNDGSVHDVARLFAWSAAMGEFVSQVNGYSADGIAQTGLGGYSDWRVPTSVELQTILAAPAVCGVSPCIDPVFGPTQPNYYWSSTTDAGDPSNAWLVGFSGGYVVRSGKSVALFVRAVRAGM